jgi:outer membrane protein assembly factor BamA
MAATVRREAPLLTIALAFLLFAEPARAEDGDAPVATPRAAARAPPFATSKQSLSAQDLAEKREGVFVTPLPIVDSDPDTGWGFGALAYLYWDGRRDDPFFARTPYRHRLYAQVFATTNGYQRHVLDYDSPYFQGSPFRVRAQFYYEKNTAQNYFGRGASTLGGLDFCTVRCTAGGASGARTYARFDDYTRALRQLRSGFAYTLYNKYSLEDPTLRTTLERDLFGGVMRAQLGFAGQYVRVKDYTGTSTVGDDPGRTDVPATMGATRLEGDCTAGRITGCGGGFHNWLQAGFAFDTRDFEPDPNRGVFADMTAELSSRYVGSAYDYLRVVFSPRAFFSPFPQLADLVIAGRAVYSMQTEGVPFFAMNSLPLTDANHFGLGGIWTMRGYKQDRFVGPILALGNLELRWTFADFEVEKQRFALQIAPFLDVGRVFDRVDDFSLTGWRRGEGVGLHLAWNKSTIVRLDYGISDEDEGFYMDVGEQF